MQKHLQHQRDLFHNFIDSKKVFDRVWHAESEKLQYCEGLAQAIQALMRTLAV